MSAVLAGHRAGWRLIGRTGTGADVLALLPAHQCGREPLRRLSDGAGRLDVCVTGDGHYRWVLAGEDGKVIAQSPAVYRDAEGCRDAFTTTRQLARAALTALPSR